MPGFGSKKDGKISFADLVNKKIIEEKRTNANKFQNLIHLAVEQNKEDPGFFSNQQSNLFGTNVAPKAEIAGPGQQRNLNKAFGRTAMADKHREV